MRDDLAADRVWSVRGMTPIFDPTSALHLDADIKRVGWHVRLVP
jgi:hypothetical protein